MASMKVGELYEELVLNDKTGPQLANAERNFGRMGGTVNALKSSLANLGIGALGAQITRVSTEFNAGMANVASLIPGNAARVRELTGDVQRLRIALGVTGQDATAGLYATISAFGDTADTMTIMETNAKAAKAGVASLTDSINLTSAVTKAYGNTSAQAVQDVSDLALMTVRLGQTTFPELAASIGRVTPLTKALGVSQQELFATMATATGVTGGAAEVSTQLRGVLQSLMAPTEAMAELIDSLGYSNGEAMVKALGLHGTIKKITEAATASGMPLQQYLSSIEGQTLALALAGPQAGDYTTKLKEMENAAGATEAAFKEQADGVNWLGQKLQQAGELGKVAMEKIGFVGPLLTLGATVTQVIQTINLFKMAKLASAAAITAETAALGANTKAQIANATAQGGGAVGRGAGMLGRAGGAVGSALTAIGGTVGVGGGAAGLGVAGLYGVAAAGIAAVGYELYGIVKYSRDSRKAIEDLNASMRKMPPATVLKMASNAKAERERFAAEQGMTELQVRDMLKAGKLDVSGGKILGIKGGESAGVAATGAGSEKAKEDKEKAEREKKSLDRLKADLGMEAQLRRIGISEARSMAGMGAAVEPGDLTGAANARGEAAGQAENIRYLQEQDRIATEYGAKLVKATEEERDGIERAQRVAQEQAESTHRLKLAQIEQQTRAAVSAAQQAEDAQKKAADNSSRTWQDRLQAGFASLWSNRDIAKGAEMAFKQLESMGVSGALRAPALPQPMQALLAGAGGGGGMGVDVRVSVDNNGNLKTFVEKSADTRIANDWDRRNRNDAAGM